MSKDIYQEFLQYSQENITINKDNKKTFKRKVCTSKSESII